MAAPRSYSRTVDPKGYVRLRIYSDDPLWCMAAPARGRTSGCVMEHRLVMARHLGRPLAAEESVHHIDGDRANNHIHNLQLRRKDHGSGVALCCAECGSNNIIPKEIN